MVKPADRKNIAAYLGQTYEVSVTRACKVIKLPKSVFYYSSVKDDSAVVAKLAELAEQKPTRGFRYYYYRIRNEGIVWNHKKVKRVYNLLKLNRRRKHKRRLPQRPLEALSSPERLNQSWSMDFMHDVLTNGRKVRILNIIDDYNRQAIAIEADYSHSGWSVSRVLEQAISVNGRPTQIRCDNGPEFLSAKLTHYCNKENITLKYIKPGTPTQNAFIERFNRSYREDVLDAYLFDSLEQLKELSYNWQDDYNEKHPHRSLKNVSPLKYLEINSQL